MESNEPVEVYTSFNAAEAEIIRAMLEAEGVDANVAGDMQGGFPGALPEVSVLVHADDAERARELIIEHQAQQGKSEEEE
jgi:hypothetical protein